MGCWRCCKRLGCSQLPHKMLTIRKGHVAGVANPVGAEKGYQEFQFTVTDDGSIFHRPTAATNVWMGKSHVNPWCTRQTNSVVACNRTINGYDGVVLAWGNMGGDGGFPMGCGYTSVKQSCLNSTDTSYGG